MDVYFILPIDLYDSLGSDDGDEENYTKVYLASEVDARIAELEREIERQKIREMRAKCSRCGCSLFTTAPNSTL